MPYTRLYYHLVWGTKKRLPLIEARWEEDLFAYLKRKAAEWDCRVLAINGWSDHVHLIIQMPAMVSVAEAVQKLKGASSHQFPALFWQRGYGALTVSERNLEAAVAYVRRQKEHHAQQTAITRFERCDDEAEGQVRRMKEESASYDAPAEEAF